MSDSPGVSEFSGFSETAAGVRVDVEVKVRASQSRVLGVKANRLSVALAAPPVDGAANAALIEALAAHFDLPRRQVQLIAGERSRRKVVELTGLSKSQLLARIPSK
ncbi:MAG TPA: DUF167 domain-containing protein [Polyangiaceae bacterium]|nr:DUF167 domain-containing protein [Polyangiaceae bacterium]